MHRRAMAAAVATLTALTTAVAVTWSAGPASAAPAPGWILLRNVHSGLVLQGRTNAKGPVVQQAPPKSGANPQGQQWLEVDRGTANGHALVSYRNAGTSSQYALAISGGSPNNGGGAILWDYKTSLADQIWELTEAIPNVFPPVYTLKNYNSDKCLAIPGSSTQANVQAIQWTCNGLTDQMWEYVQ
jgi:hypothetical protein